MKSKYLLPLGAALGSLLIADNPLHAQGTVFTYQGRLNDSANPANGSYDVQFTLYPASSGGSAGAGPLTNAPTALSNGLFTVVLDFGPGVFTGTNYWLDVAVRTNGGGAFTELTPRQPLTPTPYAIYAESVPASGISGTLTNAQLLHSAVTLNPGPGLSGGGKVFLGNTITLTNTGVLSVTGNADITVATVGGAVTLGDTATSTDTASTLVKRDGSGNFSAATLTLDGNLHLPATTATAGIIYSGGSTLAHAYGIQNFFAGPGAGNLSVSGLQNTASGNSALHANTDGSDNTANGFQALLANTTGNFNTASGAYALYSNTGDGTGDGSENTAAGYAALYFNTLGNDNTASGAYALENNANGNYNTANGAYALASNTNGNYNTANGYHALFLNTSGSENTANGRAALYNNTSGSQNTASGVQALNSNTTGSNNTANGYQALNSNTSGADNTANGWQALYSNTSGSENAAVGAWALAANTRGADNTAVGNDALSDLVTGNNNIALGDSAGRFLTSGSGNIVLGAGAGSSIFSGNNDIEIGNAGISGDDSTIRIGVQGTQTATFVAGIYGTTVSGSAVTVNANGRLGVAPSAQRFKRDIHSMDDASSVLLSLRPVTFKYKPGIDPKGTPQFGLVAEEVDKVDPDLVVRDGKDQIFTVRYEAVNAMLLNEFLKQHRKVEEQNEEIGKQNTKLRELSQKVDAQNSANAELQQRLDTLEQIIRKQN